MAESLRRRWAFLAGITLLLVPADQLTKFTAVKNLTPGLERAAGGAVPEGLLDQLALFYGSVRKPCDGVLCREISVIDGFWLFHYAENPGAAFSMLARAPESLRAPLFFLTTIIALGFVLWYLRKLPAGRPLVVGALMLIFAGAIGNLIDRIYLGYVIDFIHWYAGEHHWPTFNVADSAISCGAVLLLLDVLFSREKRPEGATAPAQPT